MLLYGRSTGDHSTNTFVTSHQRFEMRIPVPQEISTALLHPALEVTLRDLIWKIETRMIWFEYRHRRQLVGHAKRPRLGLRIRGKIAAQELSVRISQYDQ